MQSVTENEAFEFLIKHRDSLRPDVTIRQWTIGGPDGIKLAQCVTDEKGEHWQISPEAALLPQPLPFEARKVAL